MIVTVETGPLETDAFQFKSFSFSQYVACEADVSKALLKIVSASTYDRSKVLQSLLFYMIENEDIEAVISSLTDAVQSVRKPNKETNSP